MKGTRLWQAPGSPLISGRSRRLRPFWQPWILGSLLATGFIVAWLLIVGPHSMALAVAAGGFAGVLIGAACGVWVARQAGWNASWLPGAACGVIAACSVFALMAIPFLKLVGTGGS